MLLTCIYATHVRVAHRFRENETKTAKTCRLCGLIGPGGPSVPGVPLRLCCNRK